MNCKNCGNVIGPNDTVCSACGTMTGIQPQQMMNNQNGMPQVQQPMAMPNMQQPTMNQMPMGNGQQPMMGGNPAMMQQKPPKNNSNMLLILIIVVLLIAVCVAGFFLLKDDSKSNDDDSGKVVENKKDDNKDDNKGDEDEDKDEDEDDDPNNGGIGQGDTIEYNGYIFKIIDGYKFASTDNGLVVKSEATMIDYRIGVEDGSYSAFVAEKDELITLLSEQGFTNVQSGETTYNGKTFLVIMSDQAIFFFVGLTDNVTMMALIQSTGNATGVDQVYADLVNIVDAYDKTSVINAAPGGAVTDIKIPALDDSVTTKVDIFKK